MQKETNKKCNCSNGFCEKELKLLNLQVGLECVKGIKEEIIKDEIVKVSTPYGSIEFSAKELEKIKQLIKRIPNDF